MNPQFTSAKSATFITNIKPSRGWTTLGLNDIWAYRELFYFLVWREIQGNYRQTALGLSWLILRPIANVLVLSLVFGGIIGVPSDDVPYPLFSLAALLPWGLFSIAVQRSASSLVQNMHIISKIYFPRLIIPMTALLAGVIDFLVALVVFFVALFLYGYPLRAEMLWLPLFMLIALLFALAVGLWLATLSVKYRDVAFAVNYLLQALMYASPVIYSVNLVPQSLQLAYKLNPMTGIIQGFRWALLGSESAPNDLLFFISVGIILLGLVSGAYVFRRTERTIVDLL